MSRIIKSYRSQESIEVVGFCFQGRKAYNETDELINDELTYYDEDIEMITMIDQNRKKINGKLQTTVNTDFDVKYDEVNKIVEKLNAIIQ